MGAAALLGGVGAIGMFAAVTWATQGSGGSSEMAVREVEPRVAIEQDSALSDDAKPTVTLAGVDAPASHEIPQEAVVVSVPVNNVTDDAVSEADEASTVQETSIAQVAPSDAIVSSALIEYACTEEAIESPVTVVAVNTSAAIETTTTPNPVAISLPNRERDALQAYLRDKVPRIEFDTSKQTILRLIFAAEDAKAKRKRQAEKAAALKEPNELSTVAESQSIAATQPKLLQRLIARRADVEGLQFRWGDQCQAEDGQALALDEISKAVRAIPLNDKRRNERILELLDNAKWHTVAAIPALEQILQVESAEIRLRLIEILRTIEGPESGQAIARRALYDLDEVVRQAAIFGLHDRPASDYEPTLVEGLRYPWEVAAWNAADALAQLSKDRNQTNPAVVDALLDQLEQPPPTAPFQDEQGNWRVRELASLGHLQNCVLCHAPSRQQEDRARGTVPTPSNPSGSPNVYYGSSGAPFGDLVRADVTYLKQDFSVVQQLENTAPWPSSQRIDYLVRARRLTLEEHAEAAARARAPDNPHRLALLYALRELTGLEQTELLALR
jgi:hypothetical protein